LHDAVGKPMNKANPVCQVILGMRRCGGIGFQPVCISDHDDKLEAYPTMTSWKLIPHGRDVRSCPILPELRRFHSIRASHPG
jgi:hypothetical protein